MKIRDHDIRPEATTNQTGAPDAGTSVPLLGQESAEQKEEHTGQPRTPQLSWKTMTGRRKGRMVGQAVVQAVLTLWMLRDIHRRSADQLKGSKRLWTLMAFVQPVGPVAYIFFGRK